MTSLTSTAPGVEASDTPATGNVSVLNFLPSASQVPLAKAPIRFAKPSPNYSQKLDASLQALQDAAKRHANMVQATSLGAEDMVLSDLIARHSLGIAIATLETGKLHRQTLALLQRLEQHYGLQVEVYRPSPASVAEFAAVHAEDAIYQSQAVRKACCQIRKMEPLAQMLQGRSAWITGLRHEQSSGRGQMPMAEVEANGREKINPLIDWTWGDVWHYIASFDVPYNPLHDQFFPSIGCQPCTRSITVGEDFRAGRWWWEQDRAKECGLHVKAPAN